MQTHHLYRNDHVSGRTSTLAQMHSVNPRVYRRGDEGGCDPDVRARDVEAGKEHLEDFGKFAGAIMS